MGMNLVITEAVNKTKGPKTSSGAQQPAIRGFMDDLTITTTTHVQEGWILAQLGKMVTWARMTFKAIKSRSLVIRQGKMTNRVQAAGSRRTVPSAEENQIKCLGRWFVHSDKNNILNTEKQTEDWLNKINKCSLLGKFKAWLYQHCLLPRLTWLLTVYDIPTTAVEKMGRKINKYICKWLGIPPSFTSITLYVRSGQQVQSYQTYWDSRDQLGLVEGGQPVPPHNKQNAHSEQGTLLGCLGLEDKALEHPISSSGQRQTPRREEL